MSLRLFCTLAVLAFAPSFAFAQAPAFPPQAQAFLAKHCTACHGEKKANADLRLHNFTDAASLVKARKTWSRVLTVLKAGEMPPVEKPQPLANEKEEFIKTVEAIFDHADRTAKPDPGRVTMRRLNRNEYNRTIRDLVGIDFNPAEDFPSDDVGHGFDNIGDVLTLPPVLLERYLAAAETIMNRAITPVSPKVTSRHIGSQYTEPAAAKIPMKGNYRIVDSEGKGVIETGPINTAYMVPELEDYEFRSKVYVETTGKKPVRIAVIAVCDKNNEGLATEADMAKLSGVVVKNLMPCRIAGYVEVKARNDREAQDITVKIPPLRGFSRTAIAIVKPEAGEPAPNLFVQYLGLNGPLDSRPVTHRKLLATNPKATQQEQSREVLARFASRAYRRPATKAEVDRLVQLADAAIARGDKWESAMQFAMQAVLVSPKFLFRVELESRSNTKEMQPLDEYQLASRLSYFLWASMPDDELFELAAKKQLTPKLEEQVKRMLRDPRANSLVSGFVMQWLQLQNLKNFQPDPKLFPNFNDQLRLAMFTETQMFFEELIREDRSILQILDSDYTYLNGPLSRHYGIADTAGNLTSTPQKLKKPGGQPIRNDNFVRVTLKDNPRGGVLTQASVLSVTSNPTRTSPVKRGRWVLEQLLGTPPPSPPSDVPELEKDGKPVSTGTLRQRMELHRKNIACANCHAKMDPLGFGLENFNAVGAFRNQDEEQPIDATGELPGGVKFNGPSELKAILLNQKALFTRCISEKLLTYALGRGLEFYDKRAVDGITAATAKAEYRLSALVLAIVQSEPFRFRRGLSE